MHKAKFGHTVFVNGIYAGSYDFCFTPGYHNTGSEWSGSARFSIQGGDSVLVKQEVDGITVAPYGKTERLLSVDFPQTPGRYELLLEITFNGEPVISSRLFNIE